MKKTFITLTTMAVVGFGSLFASQTTYAESIDDLKSKQSEVQDERKELKKDLSKTESQIADVLIDLKELNDEINSLEETLKANEKAMKQAQKDIKATEKEIEAFEEEIAELQEVIDKRNEILKDRAVSIQKSGGDIAFLDVVFGSQNFGQLISRISAMNKISDSDMDLIRLQEEDIKKIEKKQQKLEVKLADLKEMEKELEGIAELIKEQKVETEAKREKVKSKEEELNKVKSKLKVKDSDLAALESKINVSIDNLTKPKQLLSSSSSSTSNATQVSGSGSLGWPTVGGYISSPMGQRWGRMHKGIDIARTDRSTSPPIFAAEDGVVQSAGFSGAYGNKVVISHADGLQTIYAHLSSLSVSSGQSVSKGTQLGIMGRTGSATGIHLHFEVYKNGALQNPTNYVGK